MDYWEREEGFERGGEGKAELYKMRASLKCVCSFSFFIGFLVVDDGFFFFFFVAAVEYIHGVNRCGRFGQRVSELQALIGPSKFTRVMSTVCRFPQPSPRDLCARSLKVIRLVENHIPRRISPFSPCRPRENSKFAGALASGVGLRVRMFPDVKFRGIFLPLSRTVAMVKM